MVIQPIDIAPQFRELDTPVMLGASLLLLGLLFSAKSIGRIWGGLMLVSYAAYMLVLFSTGMPGAA